MEEEEVVEQYQNNIQGDDDIQSDNGHLSAQVHLRAMETEMNEEKTYLVTDVDDDIFMDQKIASTA